MATAKQIINKALSYEGVKEDRNGYVIFNKRYWGRDIDAAWCAAFVWCVFQDCNASELFFNGNKCAYVPTIADWGIAEKLTVPKSQGRYGDLVTFDWDHNGNSDHIGFIINKNADGSYQTIEGNTSLTNQANGGQVMIRTRYQSSISYIIRPKYNNTPSISPIANYNMHLKDLQYALNEDRIRDKNGNILYEDGLWGELTDSAVKKICLSTKTRGRYSNTTSWVQCRVGASVDGIFGDATTKKVKEYQVKKKLTSDGIVGYNTMMALLKDCSVNV